MPWKRILNNSLPRRRALPLPKRLGCLKVTRRANVQLRLTLALRNEIVFGLLAGRTRIPTRPRQPAARLTPLGNRNRPRVVNRNGFRRSRFGRTLADNPGRRRTIGYAVGVGVGITYGDGVGVGGLVGVGVGDACATTDVNKYRRPWLTLDPTL